MNDTNAGAALLAITLREELARLVHTYGATLRLGFKGRYAYLQAQWPGAEEALSILRAENYEVTHYLTEAEEAENPQPDDAPERPRRLQAERMELAFAAVEMRQGIDAVLAPFKCRMRLSNDGKRAWWCLFVDHEWVPVMRARKGNATEVFTLHGATTTPRPNVAAIERGLRRVTKPQALEVTP